MSEAEERPDRDPSPDERMVELDRLNQELLESGRLKSAFLANLSHELRSPLTAILGFSEVLRDQIAGPLNARQLDQIDQIREAGKRLLNLIEEVLDLARIEAGYTELEPANVFPRQILDAVAMSVRQPALKEGVAFAWGVPAEADQVFRSDGRKLKQAIHQVALGSIRSVGRGQRVSLEAAREGDEVVFRVIDTGPLVSDEDRSILFREFGRSTSPEVKARLGTGVGLAIARRVCQLHGGSISLDAGPGPTNIFTIRIPAGSPGGGA